MIIKYVDYNENIGEKSCKTCANKEKCPFSSDSDITFYFDIKYCMQYKAPRVVQTISFHDIDVEREILELIKSKRVKYARIND